MSDAVPSQRALGRHRGIKLIASMSGCTSSSYPPKVVYFDHTFQIVRAIPGNPRLRATIMSNVIGGISPSKSRPPSDRTYRCESPQIVRSILSRSKDHPCGFRTPAPESTIRKRHLVRSAAFVKSVRYQPPIRLRQAIGIRRSRSNPTASPILIANAIGAVAIV